MANSFEIMCDITKFVCSRLRSNMPTVHSVSTLPQKEEIFQNNLLFETEKTKIWEFICYCQEILSSEETQEKLRLKLRGEIEVTDSDLDNEFFFLLHLEMS